MTVSDGQQRDSAIHIHVSILLQTPLPSRLPHNTEQSSFQRPHFLIPCDWRLGFQCNNLERRTQISKHYHIPVQFSLVAQLCPTLCNPVDCSTPGFLVHHQLLEFTQTHVHWVSDAIQPCHPLSSPSPPAFSLSQHQGLFKWVSSSHQVAEVLEFQLQHQSFQWIFRTEFL